MVTLNETSKPKAADPVSRSHLANVTSAGSVALSGLEKEGVLVDESARYIRLSPPASPSAAEEQTVTPVAGGMDLFEMMGLMYVAEGRISETRFRRAMEAVRQGVSRE